MVLDYFLSKAPTGNVFFADPSGVPAGDGSEANPWDLQTALNHPAAVLPGDTVFLRGGIYRGMFVNNLKGAINNPIFVRSFPGEWAVIDEEQPLTLAVGIGTGRETFTFAEDFNLPQTIVVHVDDERIQLTSRNGRSYKINARGWSGTVVAPHSAGAKVRVIESPLVGNGSDVIFADFEITNSRLERVLTKSGSNPVDFNRRLTGFNLYAPRSKAINLVIHDTGQGIGFWSSAEDAEIYGNILFNNGEEAPDRGHGHGIYTQNNLGRKTVAENIMFGNFGGFGIQVYGSSSAILKGYDLKGNINFLNQFLVGGNAPSDDITVAENILFNEGFRFGYGNPNNGSIKVIDNFAYAPTPADFLYWQNIEALDNEFIQNNSSSGASVVITLPVGVSVQKYNFNFNDYVYGRSFQDKPFVIKTPTATKFNFNEWRSFGLDVNGSWLGATSVNISLVKPTTNRIFYRPNKYQKGRSHIAVCNFENLPQIRLDLAKTELETYTEFEIRNAMNFKAGPLYTGVFDGSPVDIDVKGLQIAQPSGNCTKRNAEQPNFHVFVVIPKKKIQPPPVSAPIQTARGFAIEFLNPGALISYSIDNGQNWDVLNLGTPSIESGKTYELKVK